MIEELGPEARALLDAAREGMSPDAAAVRRVRAKVSVAVGATAGTAVGVKLGIAALVAVVVAVVAGVGLSVRRDGTAAVMPAIELASPSEAPLRVATHEPAVPARSDDELITIEAPRVASPPGAVPAIEAPRVVLPARPHGEAAMAPDGELPARVAPVRRGRLAPEGRGAGAGGVENPPRGIDLAREVALLDVAMAALRRGDATGALVAVQQHAAETAGRGQLAEDAAAIEIEALCHLHDPTTNTKLEAFDARFPRSAQRSRLANQCP